VLSIFLRLCSSLGKVGLDVSKLGLQSSRRSSSPREDDLRQENDRLMYITSTYPTDNLPLDQLIEHHLRMLSISSAKFVRTIVLDNHPPCPWWNACGKGPQDEILKQLSLKEKMLIEPVNYDLLDSSSFFGRFFQVAGWEAPSVATMFPQDDSNWTSSWVRKQQYASNFLSMLHVLQTCMDKGEDVQLCVYVDPDILVYRSDTEGIVDEASAIFADNPKAVVMNAPNTCERRPKHRGKCEVNTRPIWLSSRLMIINRDRLVQMRFPLQVDNKSFPDWSTSKLKPFFEKTFQDGLVRAEPEAFVLPLCGGRKSFFALHPPPAVTMYDFLASLASRGSRDNNFTVLQDADSLQFDENELQGTKVLLQRFEAGTFDLERVKQCQQILPDKAEVQKGLAW